MPGTKHQARQHALDDAIGLRFFLLDAGNPLPAHAVDVGLLEARLAQHVGIQRHRRLQILLQRGQVGAAAIQSGIGTHIGTQRLRAIGKCQRIEVACAFIQ